MTCPSSGCSRTTGTPGPPWSARRWSGCGTWSPGSGSTCVLCYSPDRLARKFAYQALLIEEFTRAGTRVEFVKGPRGDSPEDQLLVQFQGMFAEYEKAQILERYRRGKAHRAKTGSGQRAVRRPVRLPVRAQDRRTPAPATRSSRTRPALVAELFRRYADDGASIAELARWLTEQGVPTRTGKTRWDRSVVWGMLRNPAYAGQAVLRQDHGRAASPPASTGSPGWPAAPPAARSKTVDRPRRGVGATSRSRPSSAAETFERAAQRLADNKRFASRNSQGPLPAAGPGRLRGLRIRLLPHLAPAPPTRRSTTTGASAATTTATSTAGSAPTSRSAPTTSTRSSGTTSPRLLADPALIRAEIDQRLERRPHRRSRHPRSANASPTALAKATAADHPDDRRLPGATDHHRRAAHPHARPARPRDQPAQPDRRPGRPARRPRGLPQARRRPGRLPRPACAPPPPPPPSTNANASCGCSSRTSSSAPKRSPSGTASRSASTPPAAEHDTAAPTRRVTIAAVAHCVGGVVSPILSNIYLHRLDRFVEQVLLPEYNRGRRRRPNPEYQAIEHAIARARRRGDRRAVRLLRLQRRSLPSQDPDDPDYRRLRYTRYADDWLLGFAGPKDEAEQIKSRIAAFLREELKLELSPSKTLITHAASQRGALPRLRDQSPARRHQIARGRRSVNGGIGLCVPKTVIRHKCALYKSKGRPAARGALIRRRGLHHRREVSGRVRGARPVLPSRPGRFRLHASTGSWRPRC